MPPPTRGSRSAASRRRGCRGRRATARPSSHASHGRPAARRPRGGDRRGRAVTDRAIEPPQPRPRRGRPHPHAAGADGGGAHRDREVAVGRRLSRSTRPTTSAPSTVRPRAGLEPLAGLEAAPGPLPGARRRRDDPQGAARLRETEVPVFAVNFGTVGFLAAVERDQLDDGLAAAFEGDLRGDVDARPRGDRRGAAARWRSTTSR